MSENEFRLRREVNELKAEVRRLKRIVEGSLIIIVLIAVMVVPQLLVVGVVGGIGYLAFALTPLGRKIFPYLFSRRDTSKARE